jgi:hypothetical protein
MMETEKTLTGGCLCGAIRYELVGAPIVVNACYCTDCQRLSGAPVTVNIVTESENVRLLSGDIVTNGVPTGSGGQQTIHRCASCGARLWSNYNMGDVIRFVAAGTLDDPAAVTPDVHFYLRSRAPWLVVPDDVPTAQDFYDVKAVWPAESIARWKAASTRA